MLQRSCYSYEGNQAAAYCQRCASLVTFRNAKHPPEALVGVRQHGVGTGSYGRCHRVREHGTPLTGGLYRTYRPRHLRHSGTDHRGRSDTDNASNAILTVGWVAVTASEALQCISHGVGDTSLRKRLFYPSQQRAVACP